MSNADGAMYRVTYQIGLGHNATNTLETIYIIATDAMHARHLAREYCLNVNHLPASDLVVEPFEYGEEEPTS